MNLFQHQKKSDFVKFFKNIDVLKLDLGNFQDTYWGDYIDFIKKSDVTSPVMKGRDKYGRPFVVVKVLVGDNLFYQTFFQRYSDDELLWMGAGWSSNTFLNTVGGMKDPQFILIKELIEQYLTQDYSKKKIILKEHKTCESLVGKEARIIDFNKVKAYNTICKAWITCSFNPEYKICQKKQKKIYENLQKNY